MLNDEARAQSSQAMSAADERPSDSLSIAELSVIEQLYPELFPFGCGGPSAPRVVYVSPEELVRHYLRLSGGQFARHELFVQKAFQLISLGRSRSATSLRLFPRTSADDITQSPVSAEDLAKLCASKASNRRRRRRHRRAKT